MAEKLDTELFRAIKLLNPENLADDDKKDLLSVFVNTNNAAIRNQIALILTDSHYNAAVPAIIKKINEKRLFNCNGTLVYALESLDILKYFTELIKIICEQGYEARVMAYAIVQKYVDSISSTTRKKSLHILKSHRLREEKMITEEFNFQNSTLHFIESTEKLLLNSQPDQVSTLERS